jgi:hypothetical protein
MTSPTVGGYWGADTPISMPEANPNNETIVNMGAHGFGLFGLTHNITEAQLEDYKIPTFQPPRSNNG